jgi:hypothetical protein
MSPLVPDEPALEVNIFTFPLEVAVPSPLMRSIAPPVDNELLPALSLMPPPTPVELSPTVIKMFPPLPPELKPVWIRTVPDDPDAASPDAILI